jgi:hypothetical protein
VIVAEPSFDVGDAIVIEGGAGGIGASSDVCGVFIRPVAAGAFILYPSVPTRLVPVAAIKIGDVSCNPALEGLGKLTHNLAHAVPVYVVEGGAKDLISSAEEILGFSCAPMFVDGCFDG